MLPVALGAAIAARKGKIVSILIGTLAGLVVCVALLGVGYYYGHKHESDACDAAQLKQETDKTTRLADAIKENTRLERELAAARNERDGLYEQLRNYEPRIVTQYIERPGEEPKALGHCPVTRGFVRVYDDANFGRLSDATGIAPGAAVGTGTAELELAPGIGRGEILDTHITNAKTCNAIRDQLNALIDWHEAQLEKR